MTIPFNKAALIILLVAIAPDVMAVPWSVSVSENDGLPSVTKGGVTVLSANYAFWASNWKWADQRTEFKAHAPFEYSIAGRNQALNFDLSAQITKPSNTQLKWKFDLNARGTKPDVIGGGIVFKFDLGSLGRDMGEPELLPNNQGWSWGRQGRARVEMRFDPPLASVYFEKGHREEIRAMFYRGIIPAGNRNHTAVFSISGDMQIAPTISERFDPVDMSGWQADVTDWRTSPVDLSFLNAPEKPAGKRGPVKALNDKLVFEDGTVARFWGTNLTAAALYGTRKENVRVQARRLSQLGFNLVRLHHHDSPWVDPNIFGDQKRADTHNLSSAMLDKLDWWIKCLKEEGIYVWLDLHVQRGLKPGDQIEGFEEISKGGNVADLKGYNYVNPDIQQAMKHFNEAYLNHGNNYTGLRYKDEPAIAAILITNENDVTHHFGNALLPDKNVPRHNALYMNRANAFAAVWGLPRDKIWRSWEQGPSKIFLNDLEQRFNVDMIAHLRAQGVRAPVATTNYWGLEPLSSLPALTAGDLIDAHSYGGIGELEKNPLYAANMVHWIAAAQIAGKPLSVTEWNVESFPAPDRHAIPIYMAASASLQGWDVMMQYAYSQIALNDQGGPSNWHAFNDPSLIATLPAAALLYRQGHVQEARNTYAFAPNKEQLFNQYISPANSVALRTAAEKGKLVIALPSVKELPWLKKSLVPADAKVITDPNQSLIADDASEVVSETGEVRRNWEMGVLTVSTPRTQAAMGWIGGKTIVLSDVRITAMTRNATVAVQSLDGNPISQSRYIVISLGARSMPKSGTQTPSYFEPVEGKLAIAAPQGLKLRVWDASIGKMKVVPSSYNSGQYSVRLDKALRSNCLFLSS